MTVAHANLEDAELHKASYYQDADPGAVGAGMLWVDTTTPGSFALKVRNEANSGWEALNSAGGAGTSIPMPPVPSGNYVSIARLGSNNGTVGTNALTANRLYGTPTPFRLGETITRIGVNVTSGGAGGTGLRFGIYEYNGTTSAAGFGALLLDAGTVAADATGTREVTGLSYVVPATGWYVLACVSDGTPTTTSFITANFGHRGNTVTTAVGTFGGYKAFTYGTLPDPFGASVENSNQPFLVARV